MATGPAEVLVFIKEYVNEESDKLFDAVKIGKMEITEAKICLEVLKHILISGEVEADEKTKLK